MEAVVSTDSWRCRAQVASGFRGRLKGLRKADETMSMLIGTWSVHGFGMNRSLVAVGIGRDHRVMGVRTLRPNRVVVFPGARYVLEMPSGSVPPRVGEEVRIDV